MAATNIVEIHVPGMGESITEATIAKWVKNDGDTVTSDDVIAELETDKATVELSPVQAGMPSGKSGVLRIRAKKGQTVNVGDLIAAIEAGAAAPAPKAAAAEAPNGAPAAKPNLDLPLAPAVRALVDENKLDVSKLPATGPGGRITKEDVLNYLATASHPQASDSLAATQSRDARGQQNLAGASATGTTSQPIRTQTPSPAPAPVVVAAAGGERREPMSKLRETIARRLVEAQHTAALLTTFNEIDMSAVMALRSKYKDSFEKTHKVGLGFMSFFAKASVAALKAIPAVNAFIDGRDIVYHDYVNMGIAVGTPRGLVVPVLRNADQMSMAQIESEIVRLAAKARDNKITVEDMAGGTFTITNGGVFGSLLSTPIINPPQSAILGMHKIEKRAVVVDDQITIRPMMYLALSYDHRIIDGQQAVTFLVKIKEALEDPARLLLGV